MSDGVVESYLTVISKLREENDALVNVLEGVRNENASLKAALDDLGDYGDLRLMRADLAELRDCLRVACGVLEELIEWHGDSDGFADDVLVWARRLLADKVKP